MPPARGARHREQRQSRRSPPPRRRHSAHPTLCRSSIGCLPFGGEVECLQAEREFGHFERCDLHGHVFGGRHRYESEACPTECDRDTSEQAPSRWGVTSGHAGGEDGPRGSCVREAGGCASGFCPSAAAWHGIVQVTSGRGTVYERIAHWIVSGSRVMKTRRRWVDPELFALTHGGMCTAPTRRD